MAYYLFYAFLWIYKYRYPIFIVLGIADAALIRLAIKEWKERPRKITPEQAAKMMETGKPKGSFWYKCEGAYIGIDNTGPHPLSREFKRYGDCIDWINEYE